jgi:hypothetical protein
LDRCVEDRCSSIWNSLALAHRRLATGFADDCLHPMHSSGIGRSARLQKLAVMPGT